MDCTATPPSPRLTSAQRDAYDRDGYLILPQSIFPPRRFSSLQAEFEGMLAGLHPHDRPETMHGPHYLNTRLFSWLLDPLVLDLVEDVIGPDIALLGSHFICKSGVDGQRVPWHQDAAYWSEMMQPIDAVTVWLAIDPADASNGCMRVMPGSHRRCGLRHDPIQDASAVFGTEIGAPELGEAAAVDVELSPNHASLHDAGLIHGSRENRSGRRRCGYTMRYVSTRVRLADAMLDRLHFYLARGHDRAGNVYGDPDRAYPEKLIVRDGHLKYARSGHA
jgi:hypothetical protein